MNRIEVIAFGGAAAVRQTPQTPFHRCINYYSVNDPLLWVVPSAEQALRSGLVADEEFCFLVPKIGDPIQDHYLLNPTYAQALSWEGQRYRRIYRRTSYWILSWIFVLLRTFLEATIISLSQFASNISSYISSRQRQLVKMLELLLRRIVLCVLLGLRRARDHDKNAIKAVNRKELVPEAGCVPAK